MICFINFQVSETYHRHVQYGNRMFTSCRLKAFATSVYLENLYQFIFVLED